MVDDTPLLREMAALFLARAGRVFTAGSGEEALVLARAIRPDLVFADVSMPGMDGAELCRRIKESPLLGDVPVVLLTGSETPEERERAVRAGADDVIPKPVERIPLLDAARRLLDRERPHGLPRIQVEAPVRLRRRRHEWAGTARNLSRGGVFVESDELVDRRAELEIALALPETPLALASNAQVIWTRPPGGEHAPGMGLRFLGLDRRTMRQLAEYVEERLPAPFDYARGEA